MKYIKKLDVRPLYKDGIGKVELWDFSHSNYNKESREETISTVASICYNQEPKDPGALVGRLSAESNGAPASAFEFVRDWNYSSIEKSLRNYPGMPFREHLVGGKELYDAFYNQRIAVFKLKVPIFVARQIMRHRSFSFQELSRRYTGDNKAKLEFWEPFDDRDVIYDDLYAEAIITYRELVLGGTRPEIARAVLPVSLYTEFWMMGDEEAWTNFFAVRMEKRAQAETREVAEKMFTLLKQYQGLMAFNIKKELNNDST